MKEKIRVMIKRPGELPKFIWLENKLDAFQEQVGGYIEAVTLKCFDRNSLPHDVVMIVNEEGKLMDLPLNFKLNMDGYHDWIVGTAIFCGADGCEFMDIPLSFGEMMLGLPELWGAR